jgi:hypothetical protein
MLAEGGEVEQAARVLGAAEQMEEKVGMRPHGPRAEVAKRVIDRIGQSIGESERDRLRDEGRSLSLDDAVALATKAE